MPQFAVLPRRLACLLAVGCRRVSYHAISIAVGEVVSKFLIHNQQGTAIVIVIVIVLFSTAESGFGLAG